jgi:hypothetical protein
MSAAPKLCLFVAGVLPLGWTSAGRAATFCVSHTGQFAAALSAAQADGADDIIYVVAGTYTLSAALEFNSTEAHALTVLGGLDATCSTITTSFSTLNGQNLYRALYISNSNGPVAISRMGFQSGTAGDLDGGAGLYVYSGSGNVFVGSSRFLGNNGSLGGGVNAGSQNGQIAFVGNLVASNHAIDFGAGSLYQGSGEAYVIGNTIVNNGNDPGQNTGGLALGGNAHFTLANNILWNNTTDGGYDLYAGATHSRLHNDLGVAGGPHASPDVAQGNLSVDPGFVDCPLICLIPYELGSKSALVNAGDDAPGYGIGTLDITLEPRLVGAHVDIGAYENEDALFRDGFGP